MFLKCVLQKFEGGEEMVRALEMVRGGRILALLVADG
jgi:hypothetical protein